MRDPHIFPIKYVKACAMNFFEVLVALRYEIKREICNMLLVKSCAFSLPQINAQVTTLVGWAKGVKSQQGSIRVPLLVAQSTNNV